MEPDETYATAQPKAAGLALGRTFAAMYQGMVEGGMDTEDALATLHEYVASLAANSVPDEE